MPTSFLSRSRRQSLLIPKTLTHTLAFQKTVIIFFFLLSRKFYICSLGNHERSYPCRLHHHPSVRFDKEKNWPFVVETMRSFDIPTCPTISLPWQWDVTMRLIPYKRIICHRLTEHFFFLSFDIFAALPEASPPDRLSRTSRTSQSGSLIFPPTLSLESVAVLASSPLPSSVTSSPTAPMLLSTRPSAVPSSVTGKSLRSRRDSFHIEKNCDMWL